MNLKEFNELVKKEDDNIIEGDEGLSEIFKEIRKEKFGMILLCKKCQSSKIQIIGENGMDYGGETGYDPGSNVIKCLDCGNAVTIYK